MTPELLSLVLLALFAPALTLFYSGLYGRQIGLGGILGPREDVPEPKGLAGRGLRAHRNLLENLVPYAIAVLVAHALGVSNAYTVGAAWAFLGARLVHAFAYLAAIKGLRSLAYNVGVAATLVILVEILLK
jgi:uncharacterized MAPEG superfamily protein